MKKLLKIAGIVIGIAAAAAAIYVASVFIMYSRIPDKETLSADGKPSEETLETGREYTIVTQNVGFGAYSPDFSFFMDGGKQSWANDRDTVVKDINMACEEISSSLRRSLPISEGFDKILDLDSVGWAHPFPTELLPEGISQCLDYDDEQPVPTCRNCDVPYGPGCNVVIVDGFLTSDNITCTELHNIDTGFSYSDHNPVVMRFELE